MALCVDLFAGGGGFTIGFKRAGYQVIGYEWIKNIQENAKKNGLDIRHANIFSDTFIQQLPPNIEVIVGGPPCQSFSAGNTKGTAEKDKRNGIEHFLDIVNIVRPQHFIMENAPTLMQKHRDYCNSILEKIELMGYKCKAKVVDMSYFRVPQARKRTIIFGTLKDLESFSLENLTTTQMPVEDVLTRAEIESVNILDWDVPPINSNFNNTHINSENKMSRIPFSVLKRMRTLEGKNMRIMDIKKPSNTLTIQALRGASTKGFQNTAARFLFKRWGRPNTDNPYYNEAISYEEYVEKSKNIPISVYGPWKLRDNWPTILGGFHLDATMTALRGLTIHEMRRIQTFPDDYTFESNTMPKTRDLAETIIGNSVPPTFAYVLASRLSSKSDEDILSDLGKSSALPNDLTLFNLKF